MTKNSLGAVAVQGSRVDLRPDTAGEVATGGTVIFRAYVGDRWVGWIGDHREWKGHRWGGRKWWGCWREDGDTYARARVDDQATRKAAVTWLQEVAR